MGQPLRSRPREVMGIEGTLEVRIQDRADPTAPATLLTLGRHVSREPRDVCFGDYLANEDPENGDAFCQVRGHTPLILTLVPQQISPTERFALVWGQANSNVSSVELTGVGSTPTPVPLSVHRMFAIAFTPSVRGAVHLTATLTGGALFEHTFTLPLTRRESGAWPVVTRRGAIPPDVDIGENIVTRSYRQILRMLGPPLKIVTRRSLKCLYYDTIGHPTGWEFCFHGQAMTSAAGNQAPPRA